MSLFVLLAAMCLPPPPGMPVPKPPSEAEKARTIATTSDNIVAGVVTRNDGKRPTRFKILKVYKGKLKPGQVIDAYAAHGFYSDLPCPWMITPVPTLKGARGVIAFDEIPAALRWVEPLWLEEMIKAGLIEDRR